MCRIRMMAWLLGMLAVIGCGGKVVDVSNLVERDGLLYEVNSEKPFSGTSVSYFPSGKKKIVARVRKGKLNGKATSWYENGQIEMEEDEYRNGKLTGMRIKWFENGQKNCEVEYRDGNPDGRYIGWYENGKKQSRGKFRNGKQNGIWEYWDKNGQKSAGELVDGRENGKWTYWYDGKTIVRNYENGERVADPSNLVKRDGLVYENGDDLPFTGKTAERYPDGTLKTVQLWCEGIISKETVSSANGRSLTVTDYKDGKYDNANEWHFEKDGWHSTRWENTKAVAEYMEYMRKKSGWR